MRNSEKLSGPYLSYTMINQHKQASFIYLIFIMELHHHTLVKSIIIKNN